MTKSDLDLFFDFDYWAALATDNPKAFEAQRKKLLDDFIDAAPAEYQNRLCSLQSLVDWERSLSSSAMESTVRLSQLMINKLNGELLPALEKMNQETADLHRAVRRHCIQTAVKNQHDNIIPFPNKICASTA